MYWLLLKLEFSNISNKKDIIAKYVGQRDLKNVSEPVRIYEVHYSGISEPFETGAQSLPQKSIAVLPFVNMSSEAEQDYFCDRISEEIINSLVQLNNLRVVARTSVFSFKGKNYDLMEIGRMLDVSTLLEGSVRKSGSRIRITTKLVGGVDGSHLWSNRYDRELEDVFLIQEDIAKSVATELMWFLNMD